MNKPLPNLTGQCLIAMPQIEDPRFHRSVIFLCIHDPLAGAMGIVINKPAANISFENMLKEADIPTHGPMPPYPVFMGGPLETNRGFILHTLDYQTEETSIIGGGSLGMTTTLEVLQDMSLGKGPKHALLALGYSGWERYQLEKEISENQWLNMTLNKPDILFHGRSETKWQTCLESMGIHLDNLSGTAGHA